MKNLRVELYKLLDQMAIESIKLTNFERSAFDPISKELLFHIYEFCLNIRPDSSYATYSSNDLAKITNSTRQRIRCRLKHLARYGLIKITTPPYRKGEIPIRHKMRIFINPVVKFLVGPEKLTRKKLPVIKHLVSLGVNRLEHEADLQGFTVDCVYGDIEPTQGEVKKPEQALIDIISQGDMKKAAQEKENAMWREHSEIFVEGCSSVWTNTQSKLGYGQSKPNWDAKVNELSPTARKERAELVKTFQKYGGRVSALAWYVYAGGITQLDEAGNPIYTITSPHRQFVTSDRKPSQFVKHFNAILKDPLFLEYATSGWTNIKEQLASHYLGSLEVRPRYDTEYILIGFEFGK